MTTVTALFPTAEAARNAIGDLHVAGFGHDDIAFMLNAPDPGRRPDVNAAESTGRRVGELAADIGTTALNMMPFVGRNIADSPMGRAMRRALENTGSTAGMLAGAMYEGGYTAVQTDPLRSGRARATVTVRTEAERGPEAMAVLARAGAVAVESAPEEGPTSGGAAGR